MKYLGFIINRYDRCVANKTIYRKQFTIVWHVDDNKLPHVDPNVVTDILTHIKKQFVDLVISRGDTVNFLGINIKIMKYKKVEIIMKLKIEDIVSLFNDIFGLRFVPHVNIIYGV